jgi:uncharacterized protein
MLLTLAVASFFTAVLSATFGMAGGLVLMGVYTAVLPVEAAMVLHGATQLLANGLRAAVHVRRVRWDGVLTYAIGGALGIGLMALVAFVPSRTLVYLLLGAIPFAARLIPRAPWLDFARRPAQLLAGFLVCAVQVLAGVAGPILDVFFLGNSLDRHEIVGTKAATQTLSHAAKIAYFLPLLPDAAIPDGAVPAVLIGAGAGTLAGSRLLDRWSDQGFRAATRWIVLGIGAVYLVMGMRLALS